MTVAKRVKKLENRCSALWKEICFLRDGRQCQVQKLYPTISIVHKGYLQVDHCITRKNKHFFFEPKNGTVVCGACNRAKHYKQKSIDRAIDEIVEKREGSEWFEYMVGVDRCMKPNVGWKKLWWLQEQVEELEKTLADLDESKKKGSDGAAPLPDFLSDD